MLPMRLQVGLTRSAKYRPFLAECYGVRDNPAWTPRPISMNPVAEYALLLLAGCAAGIINTIAGGGSFLTLPVLMAVGLSPSVANGTNRIAVVVQTAIGSWQFHRALRIDYSLVWRLAPALVVGSVAGAWLASILEPERFERAFGVLLICMGVVVALKSRLIQLARRATEFPRWLVTLSFLAIGVFGGFIQAGVGILLVGAMVLLLNLDTTMANSVKLVLVLVFTLPALAVFAARGQVELPSGLVLSAGNALGAWLGVRISFLVPPQLLLVLIAIIAGATGAYLWW